MEFVLLLYFVLEKKLWKHFLNQIEMNRSILVQNLGEVR